MSNLAFYSADTLGMELFQLGDTLKANETRQVEMGPWKFDVSVEALSDLLTGREATFWMKIANELRFYFIQKERSCYLAVLDTKKLKEQGKITGWAANTLPGRWKEIKPAIIAVFEWKDSTKSQWDQVLLDHVQW